MRLTAKQENFAQAIADGMTQADAYRSAYIPKKMSDNAIYRDASVMVSSPKISQRVSELRSALEKKALWTREMSVKALVAAYREGNGAVKVSAVKELNLMHGFNAPQKHEVSGVAGAPIEILTGAKLEKALEDRGINPRIFDK